MLTEELRERINKLSAVKRQLLNQQLHVHRAADCSLSRPAPARAAPAALEALSYAQQTILATQRAYPGASFYHQPLVFRLDGHLDTAALAAALHFLAARHDVLRMRFAGGAAAPCGTPRLVICDRQDVGHNPPWDYQDLSPLSSALILEDVLHRHRQQPFNLADDPPLSVLLLRIAPQQHVLSLVHHYVAFDAWSLGLFYRELSLAYAAYAGGSMPHLPPLPFAYADVGVWQQSPAYAEHLAAMSHYWRWQLAKHGSVPALSGSSPAPAPSFAASSFEFVVPGGTLRRLEQLAQRENATLFMLLLASLQTLLARYTRRTEVAVGATVTNRHSLEAEAVLGNFSNRLLLWGNLEGNPSFRQLLRRTRGTTLNAYARQDFPVDSAAVELNPRLEGQGELFPVMLDYINAPLPAPTLRGLAVSRMPAAIDESAYPLHVTARRGHDHLRVRLQVRPDFDVRTTVPHMACHWNTLLAAIAEDPQQRIEHLPIVKSFETWNGAWRGPAQTLSKSNGARL